MDDTKQEQPVYSFWAEQIEASEGSLRYGEEQEPAAPPTKKKNGFMKKFLYYIAAALFFGLTASASFIGFHRLYYHFNPSAASPSGLFRPASGNGLVSSPSEGKGRIAFTEVLANVIFQQETDISGVIEQTEPATVSITSTIQNTFYYFGMPYAEESSGEGSGIIIGENETEFLIATNSHVVNGASSIKVFFIDGTEADAFLKGKDVEADLAVIAVKKADLREETMDAVAIARLGDSDAVKVGQMVIAIGNALGYGQSVTIGYISAKDRVITNTSTNTQLTVIQVDAAINPGNSGGALLNAAGEVIGINSAKLAGVKIEGIGYAIPITKAFPIVKDLMDRETLLDADRGYLGILMDSMSDVTADIAKLYNWPTGVYIREMTEGSAAEKAGLRTGDIITAVNDKAITGKDELRETVTSYRHGTLVRVTLMRYNGSGYDEMVIEVTLAPAAQAQ